MPHILKITKKEDFRLLLVSISIAAFIFSAFTLNYAFGQQAVSLTVTVNSTLSFTTSTDTFPSLTPGTSVAATTTLGVTTNNAAGWNVTLSCDERTLTVACGDLDTDTTVELPDGTEWIIAAAAATTTAGNAAAITNGDNFLFFRVMSASGSVPFLSTSWWGTSDDWFNAGQLWAGIATSTGASRIGNAGSGSYSASAHLNTVNYYLDTLASQQTGAYTIPLTYTATANP